MHSIASGGWDIADLKKLNRATERDWDMPLRQTSSVAGYHWQLLHAGPILLDGGGMFGLIPHVVWTKVIPPDDRNRIKLAHNCLLLERDAKPILIETGSGNKFGPKMRKIFGLSDQWVADALRQAGCLPEAVEHVIVTHLHFDHAGGLTRAALADEAPAWVRPADGSDDASRVVRTFPRARIIVQRREWEDALANRSVMTRTYFRDNLEPIREQLTLIESPLPFLPGHIPDRGDLPATTVGQRETEVLPGVFVFRTPGHTWGQQAVRFIDEEGRNIVYVPDVMPSIYHLGPTYNLAYDVEPYTSMCSRRWLLEEAVINDWLLVLNHEPGNPLQRVRRDGKGWYLLVPEAVP
jgi:glyoxylase-like metal-dependent hydrolase (beta-lactamase superfamily II)